MEMDSLIYKPSGMFPDSFQSLFDETARDVAQSDFGMDAGTIFDLNEFLNNELQFLPSVLSNDKMITDFGYDGDLLEIGQNVTVMSNPTDFPSYEFKPVTYAINSSCLLSPQSMSPSSQASEIIVEEFYVENLSSDDFSQSHSTFSPKTDSDQASIASGDSQLRRRGRPRKSPEVHLMKLEKGRISQKAKKTIKNNAASIKYRHKKAHQKELTEKLFTKESNRNARLAKLYRKLESDIEKLKHITRSRFS